MWSRLSNLLLLAAWKDCPTKAGMALRFSSRFQAELTPNRLTQFLCQKREQGTQILDLTESNPTRAGFGYDETAVLEAVSSPKILLYDPSPKGLPDARRAVADYYTRNGNNVDPEHIFLVASTSEAYSYLFKLLCDPGDEVLIPRPGYPLFDLLAAQESVRPISYPLRYDDRVGWQIDIEMLENSISTKTRALVVIHPNNPTGNFVKPHERDALNAICTRHGMSLIVDEVFFDYSVDLNMNISGSFVSNTVVPTFVLNGLSKIAGLPQIKLGWIHISGPLVISDRVCGVDCVDTVDRVDRESLVEQITQRLEFITDTYLSVSASAQHGLRLLLAGRERIQAQIHKRTGDNYKSLCEIAADSENIHILRPEGGWYAVLRFSDALSDESRVLYLLEYDNIFVHPGYFYDFPQDGYVVLSLLTLPAVFNRGIHGLMTRFG